MAIVRKITDGTTTIDFNDGTTFDLARNFDLGVGEAGSEVTHVISALWISTVSQDTRASTRRSIQQLLNKAKLRKQLRRAEDWVWLEVQADDETSARYAVIRGGLVASDGSNEQDDRRSILRVSITREAEWLDVAPTAAGTTSVSAVTIYNKSDGDGENYVEIDDLGGDADGEMRILAAVPKADTLRIGVKYGTTASLAAFDPYYTPADGSFDDDTGTTEADVSAPGDSRVRFTADGEPNWSIPNANMDHYIGNYRVFAWCRQISGGGSAKIGFYHGSQTEPQTMVDVSSTGWFHDLGMVSIPDYPFIPSIAGTAANYLLTLKLDITGTATVYIFSMALCPLDASFFVSSPNGDVGDNTIVVDGFRNATYLVSDVLTATMGFPLTPSGRYPRVRAAGEGHTRLFFYLDDTNTTAMLNDTMDITIYTRDKFLTTRGSG